MRGDKRAIHKADSIDPNMAKNYIIPEDDSILADSLYTDGGEVRLAADDPPHDNDSVTYDEEAGCPLLRPYAAHRCSCRPSWSIVVLMLVVILVASIVGIIVGLTRKNESSATGISSDVSQVVDMITFSPSEQPPSLPPATAKPSDMFVVTEQPTNSAPNVPTGGDSPTGPPIAPAPVVGVSSSENPTAAVPAFPDNSIPTSGRPTLTPSRIPTDFVTPKPSTESPTFMPSSVESQTTKPSTAAMITPSPTIPTGTLPTIPTTPLPELPSFASRSPSTQSTPTAATPIGCLSKKIRITEICNLPDLDLPSIFTEDNRMELKVEINNRFYWPADLDQDCTGFTFSNACGIADEEVTNGNCYTLPNSRAADIPPELFEITIREEDILFDDVIRFTLDMSSEWYFKTRLCGIINLEMDDAVTGAKIKFNIESE